MDRNSHLESVVRSLAPKLPSYANFNDIRRRFDEGTISREQAIKEVITYVSKLGREHYNNLGKISDFEENLKKKLPK